MGSDITDEDNTLWCKEKLSPPESFYYGALSPTAATSATKENKSFRSVTVTTVSTEKGDAVHFIAYAPPTVNIDSWAFLADQREDINEQAMSCDPSERQVSRELLLSLQKEAMVHIQLDVPKGFVVLGDGAVQALQWEGEVKCAKFTVECSTSAPLGQVVFKTTIVFGTKVLVLKSFIMVKSDTLEDFDVAELTTTVELVPYEYEEISYKGLKIKELIGQ